MGLALSAAFALGGFVPTVLAVPTQAHGWGSGVHPHWGTAGCRAGASSPRASSSQGLAAIPLSAFYSEAHKNNYSNFIRFCFAKVRHVTALRKARLEQ